MTFFAQKLKVFRQNGLFLVRILGLGSPEAKFWHLICIYHPRLLMIEIWEAGTSSEPYPFKNNLNFKGFKSCMIGIEFATVLKEGLEIGGFT